MAARLPRSIPLALLVATLSAAPAFAQADADSIAREAARADSIAHAFDWKYRTILGLALSQSAYSSNWAGGDKGSIIWVFSSNSSAEKQFGGRLNLSNQLKLAYGQTEKQVVRPGTTDRFWESPSKTTDQVAFESTGRLTLGGFVDPYFSFTLDSQFRDESYSPFATLGFNPVKLKESAGIARVLRKTDDAELKTRLGVGVRQVLARSVDIVTLEQSRFSSNDGGIEWQTQLTQPLLAKKVLLKSDLLVFLPVLYSKSDELKDYDALVRAGDASVAANPAAEAVADFWRAPDVNFQTTLSSAITKLVGVTLFAQLVYDKFDSAANVDARKSLAEQIPEVLKNVRKAGQFRENLAIVFTYQMF